jgi:hypothetical protein
MADNEFNQVLLEILRQEASPEAVKARNMILKRIATENPPVASRIPHPMNITEIGGYLNLLEKLGHNDLQYGMIASILGQPHKDTEMVFYDTEPVTFFSEYISDRPECPGVMSLPLTFYMRNDFSAPLSAVMKTLHQSNAYLPMMSFVPQLPRVGCVPDETMMMQMIGRRLEIAPSSAYKDPTKDPVIVAKEGLFAKGGKTSVSVNALKLTEEGMKGVEITAGLISLEPLLAQAGWYQYEEDPLKLMNITGLVEGRTTYGEELARIYTGAQIAASGVRDVITFIWDGKAFVKEGSV